MTRKERVTKVIDGDTFKTTSRKNPVRLANIDALKEDVPILPKPNRLFAR